MIAMPKTLIRIVSGLLILCLVADPAFARASAGRPALASPNNPLSPTRERAWPLRPRVMGDVFASQALGTDALQMIRTMLSPAARSKEIAILIFNRTLGRHFFTPRIMTPAIVAFGLLGSAFRASNGGNLAWATIAVAGSLSAWFLLAFGKTPAGGKTEWDSQEQRQTRARHRLFQSALELMGVDNVKILVNNFLPTVQARKRDSAERLLKLLYLNPLKQGYSPLFPSKIPTIKGLNKDVVNDDFLRHASQDPAFEECLRRIKGQVDRWIGRDGELLRRSLYGGTTSATHEDSKNRDRLLIQLRDSLTLDDLKVTPAQSASASAPATKPTAAGTFDTRISGVEATLGGVESVLDLARVGTAGLSDPKRRSLRRAAARLNAYVIAGQPPNEEAIHTLHRIAGEGTLLERLRPGISRLTNIAPLIPATWLGRYRDGNIRETPFEFLSGVQVSEAARMELDIPPSWIDTPVADRVPQSMRNYFEWLNRELKEPTDALDLAAEAYVRFVKIHPYMNANGRTGWLLVNWIVMSRGQPPIYGTPENLNDYVTIGMKIMELPMPEAIAYGRQQFRRMADRDAAAATAAQRKGTVLEGLRDILWPFGPSSEKPWYGWTSEFLNLIRTNRVRGSMSTARRELNALDRLGFIRGVRPPGHRRLRISPSPWLEAAWKHAREVIEPLIFSEESQGVALQQPLDKWSLASESEWMAAREVVRTLRILALERILTKAGVSARRIIKAISARDDADAVIEDLGFTSGFGLLDTFGLFARRVAREPGRLQVQRSFETIARRRAFAKSIVQVWKKERFLGIAVVSDHLNGHYILMTNAHIAGAFRPEAPIPLVLNAGKPRRLGQAICVLQGDLIELLDSDIAWLILPDKGVEDLQPLPIGWDSSVEHGSVGTLVSERPGDSWIRSGYIQRDWGLLFSLNFLTKGGNSGLPLLKEDNGLTVIVALVASGDGQRTFLVRLDRSLLKKAERSLREPKQALFKRMTKDQRLLDVLSDYFRREISALVDTPQYDAAWEKAQRRVSKAQKKLLKRAS
jgi:hypothetical protein